MGCFPPFPALWAESCGGGRWIVGQTGSTGSTGSAAGIAVLPPLVFPRKGRRTKIRGKIKGEKGGNQREKKRGNQRGNQREEAVSVPVSHGDPLAPSDNTLSMAAGRSSLQQPRWLLLPAERHPAAPAALPHPAAVDEHAGGDEHRRGHHGHHQQCGDRLLLLVGSHHGQQVGVLTARPHVARVAHTRRLVLLHQEAARPMEAELPVGVGALIEV